MMAHYRELKGGSFTKL